jgi:hypothetical protein
MPDDASVRERAAAEVMTAAVAAAAVAGAAGAAGGTSALAAAAAAAALATSNLASAHAPPVAGGSLSFVQQLRHARKLHVGSLPPSATEKEIADFFESL